MKLSFRTVILLCAILGLFACKNKQRVDLLIKAKGIQIVGDSLLMHEAMVVKGGKVVASGSLAFIESNYKADSVVDFADQYLYPGIIDAHCHLYGLGMFMQW